MRLSLRIAFLLIVMLAGCHDEELPSENSFIGFEGNYAGDGQGIHTHRSDPPGTQFIPTLYSATCTIRADAVADSAMYFDLNYINKGGSQGTDKSIKIHFVDSINFEFSDFYTSGYGSFKSDSLKFAYGDHFTLCCTSFFSWKLKRQ